MPISDPTLEADPSLAVDANATANSADQIDLFKPQGNALQIIGDALSHRRGIVSSILGGFMADAGNRKEAASEIPGLISAIGASGSPLSPQQTQVIKSMDPLSAIQQLSIWQKRANAKKAQIKPTFENTYNTQAKPGENPFGITERTAGPLPAGVEPYSEYRAQEAARQKQLDREQAVPKGEDNIQADAMRKKGYSEDQIWRAINARHQANSMNLVKAKAMMRQQINNQFQANLPLIMNPRMKGYLPLDKATGNALPMGMSTKDFVQGLDEGKYAMANSTDRSKIASYKGLVQNLKGLQAIGDRILPAVGKGGTLATGLKTYGNSLKLKLKAWGSDVDASQFYSQSATAIPFQTVRLFTDSTRQINSTEFAHLTGRDMKGNGTMGGLTQADLEALTPRDTDSKEKFDAKVRFLMNAAQERFGDLTGGAKVGNTLMAPTDDIDTTDAPTSTDDDDDSDIVK